MRDRQLDESVRGTREESEPFSSPLLNNGVTTPSKSSRDAKSRSRSFKTALNSATQIKPRTLSPVDKVAVNLQKPKPRRSTTQLTKVATNVQCIHYEASHLKTTSPTQRCLGAVLRTSNSSRISLYHKFPNP